MKAKKYKAPKFAHTNNSPNGMGDFYGTGIKQKIGNIREDTMGINLVTPKKLKTPPKKLA
jgi:hypothetical protein